MDYSYSVFTEKSVEEAVGKVKQVLQQQGFGTLWELNIQDKLKEKGVEYGRSGIILEVCNPQRAKEALEANSEAILFLPCKIAVYETENHTVIGMIRPSFIMKSLNDTNLENFASEVEKALKYAIDEAAAAQ